MKKVNDSKTTQVRVLEDAITTNRTISMERISRYIATALNPFYGLKRFYDRHDIQHLKLLNYRSRQRMNDKLVDILIDGGTKYTPNASRRRQQQTQTKSNPCGGLWCDNFQTPDIQRKTTIIGGQIPDLPEESGEGV
ncbi:unnamed protein product [Absidia cylindrospora]